MATVEEIYRKIRRGEIDDLHLPEVSDAQLDAGTERLHARLSGITPPHDESQKPQKKIWRQAWWIAPAIAALAVVGVLILRPAKIPQAETLIFAKGVVFAAGTVELRVLHDALLEKKYKDEKLTVHLHQGMLAIRRSSPTTALEVITPEGALTAQGTTFLVEHTNTTAVRLLEGKLLWQTKESSVLLDSQNSVIGRDLSAELMGLPAEYLARPKAQVLTRTNSHEFASGDCIFYYRNNEKRRGKIHARTNDGYIVHGAYGPEHDHFSADSLSRRDCSE